MSFDTLDKLGIDYIRDDKYETNDEGQRVRVEGERIKKVCFPLTPIEWVRMCTYEQDCYIGGCCGSASAIQDTLNHIFRYSWVDAAEFRELVAACIRHDGAETWDKPELVEEALASVEKEGKPLTEISIEQPWDKIVLLWGLCKDLLMIEKKEIPKERDPVSAAIHNFAFSVYRLAWLRTDKDAHADTTLQQAQAWAALKVIYDDLHTQLDAEVRAFVLCNADKKPLDGYRGMDLFNTKEAGEKLLAELLKYHGEDRPEIKDWCVLPCKVSVARGLEMVEE